MHSFTRSLTYSFIHLSDAILGVFEGAFFCGYSGYSYSGLGIAEYTELQFRKNAPSLETESEVT